MVKNTWVSLSYFFEYLLPVININMNDTLQFFIKQISENNIVDLILINFISLNYMVRKCM